MNKKQRYQIVNDHRQDSDWAKWRRGNQPEQLSMIPVDPAPVVPEPEPEQEIKPGDIPFEIVSFWGEVMEKGVIHQKANLVKE